MLKSYTFRSFFFSKVCYFFFLYWNIHTYITQAIPTTVIDEESNLLRGSVFQNQMKHKATHFFTTEEEASSSSFYFNRGVCAAGMYRFLYSSLSLIHVNPPHTHTHRFVSFLKCFAGNNSTYSVDHCNVQ